jgi:hypothetical protein
MKNIKKNFNFIKRYSNLKEWKKRRALKKRRKNIMLEMLQLACRTALSFTVSSLGIFVGNALYEELKLRGE